MESGRSDLAAALFVPPCLLRWPPAAAACRHCPLPSRTAPLTTLSSTSAAQAQHNTLNDHKPAVPAGPQQRLTTEQRVMGTTGEDTWT